MDKNQQSGFALLMTLLVVSVIISIGLSVLDLSVKQIRLSTNARESEVAFHAANAGMECARYIRRAAAADMEVGNQISPTCFGVAPYLNTRSAVTTNVSGDGQVFKYDYQFSWSGDTRCSQVTTLIASSTPLGSGLVISNLNTASSPIPGYPSATRSCGAGERCSIISVRGYNQPCNSIGNEGTIQREVLLQF